jgi:hypothetical protein
MLKIMWLFFLSFEIAEDFFEEIIDEGQVKKQMI